MKRHIILLTVAVIFYSTATAQNPLIGEASKTIAANAAQEAKEWTKELAMSLEQMELMEDKLIEYEMKKQEVIQSDFSAEAKSQIIINLQKSEHAAMRDILTRPQFLRYMEINNTRAKKINKRLEKSK